MPVIPNAQCCEGLDTLMITDEEQEECAPITGIALCSNCGNTLCEYGENNCNCAEDCDEPPLKL